MVEQHTIKGVKRNVVAQHPEIARAYAAKAGVTRKKRPGDDKGGSKNWRKSYLD